jgi:hypothetical protein
MRGIKHTREQDARAQAEGVDTALGLPRCEYLLGKTRNVGRGPHVTCSCTVPTNPQSDCPRTTRKIAEPVELEDGWAYPVDEGSEALNVLTEGERRRIENVTRKGANANARKTSK